MTEPNISIDVKQPTTVKDVMQRIEVLDKLANNMRLLNQWALNKDQYDLEAIADRHGMSSGIRAITEDATNELYALRDMLKNMLEDYTIDNPSYPLLPPTESK